MIDSVTLVITLMLHTHTRTYMGYEYDCFLQVMVKCIQYPQSIIILYFIGML